MSPTTGRIATAISCKWILPDHEQKLRYTGIHAIIVYDYHCTRFVLFFDSRTMIETYLPNSSNRRSGKYYFLFQCFRWSFVDPPLIYSWPADHVSDWHTRMSLDIMVEPKARSVIVTHTLHTTRYLLHISTAMGEATNNIISNYNHI